MKRDEPTLDPVTAGALASDEPVEASERILRAAHPRRRLIVWEGDPQTFEFTAVAGDSEEILGYTSADWLRPGFWAEQIVHPDDRRDAIAFCALATGRSADHVFEYRALARDGSVVWLEDHVKVILGSRGVAARLRGVMFDVSAQKLAAAETPARYRPSVAELESMGADARG